MAVFGQCGGEGVPLIEEPTEFGGHPRLLAALQLQQHMLLAGEVEEEGPVRHACGGDDRMKVRARRSCALELHDRRAEYAFPCLQPAGITRRVLDLRRHGPPFLTR